MYKTLADMLWYLFFSSENVLNNNTKTHSYPCAHTHTSKPSAEAVVQPGSYVVIASPPALSSSRPQDHLPFLIRVASPFLLLLLRESALPSPHATETCVISSLPSCHASNSLPPWNRAARGIVSCLKWHSSEKRLSLAVIDSSNAG